MAYTAGMTDPGGDRKLVLDYGSPLNRDLDTRFLESTATSIGTKYQGQLVVKAGTYRSRTQDVADDEFGDYAEITFASFLTGLRPPMDVGSVFGRRYLVFIEEASAGTTTDALTDFFAALGLPVAIFGRERMLVSAETALLKFNAELLRSTVLGGKVQSKAGGKFRRLFQRILSSPLQGAKRQSPQDLEMQERIAGNWEGTNQTHGSTMKSRMSLDRAGQVTFAASIVVNGKPREIDMKGTWRIEDGRLMCTYTAKGASVAPDVDGRVLSLSQTCLELEERASVTVMHRVQ